MASSTAVADKPGTELAPVTPEEQSLIDAARGQIDSSKLILPNLKLTQSLTAEVQAGDVPAGHFINALTGEDHGEEVEFVVAAIFSGRFYSDKQTGRSYAAKGDVAPANWPEEYQGQPFSDLPDAEEQWKAAVNANEHPWASGPPISTTHNFVGYIVEADPGLPVRISMMRSSNPAANKLKTMIWAARAPWDNTFVLRAAKKVSNDRPYFAIEVGQGGITAPDLREATVALAQTYATAADVELAEGESDAPKRAPVKKGGLPVN